MLLHLAILLWPDRGALRVSAFCLLLRLAVLQLLGLLRCAACVPKLPAVDCMTCHTPAGQKLLLPLMHGQLLSSVSNSQLSCHCRCCLTLERPAKMC